MGDVQCVISVRQFYRNRIVPVLDKFSPLKGTVARVQSEPDPFGCIANPESLCFKKVPDVHGGVIGRGDITVGGIECPVARIVTN